MMYTVTKKIHIINIFLDVSEGEIVGGAGEGDLEGVMEGEEGGGWEVGDDDLDLPPDLVRTLTYT